MSRRECAHVLLAETFLSSDTDAHVVGKPVFLPSIVGGSCPVEQNMSAEVLEVYLPPPRRVEKAFPVGVLQEPDSTAAAS